MRIPCPHCGQRSNDEFAILGDADALMARPAAAIEQAYDPHVYLRTNPAGVHRELWYHQNGCRQWLVVTRDTRTHAIFSVDVARDVARSKARGSS
jgi:methylglutamate dehydrogenase subunit B